MAFVKIEVEAAEVSITAEFINNSNQVVSTYSYSNQLTQSTVYGPWDNKYAEYNCYAFAIDRYELFTDFNFYNVGYMYEVGTFSNQRDYVNNIDNKKDVNIVSNAQNCPFPKFSYYNWSISVLSEENAAFNYHINQWGYVSVSKTCDICVIGRYLFNDNYTILYYLTIVKL